MTNSNSSFGTAAPFVSVIVPAYNEAESLPTFLAEVRGVLSKSQYTWELLVLDDASQDETPTVLSELAPELPELRVIRNLQNLGCHPSTLVGFTEANGEYRVFVPGDGQIPASEIVVMLEAAQTQQVDVLYTWRVPRADPMHRRFIGWTYNQILKLFWRIGIHDADSASLLTSKAAESIVPKLNAHSALLTTEILLVARSLELPIGECQIKHRPRSAGVAKGMNFRDFSRLPGDMLKLLQWRLD